MMTRNERWLAADRAWLGRRATGSVLEVAIGSGASLPHYPVGARITGIDLSPAMLGLSRARAARLGMSVDLVEGDAERLPFPDASFETVACALALCSIPSPERAIAEMRRVLVPGGRLLLLDHVPSTWPPIRAVQWLAERCSIPLAGEHFTRRPLPLVEAHGFEIDESARRIAGIVERLSATKR
ncbi:Methyltransferase domain-containing protein [Agrococcus carbonis]|uniref:Methyltransferase domain-containing protein n=2 Tax=Agrococcus carbonis TaxID=684552 RepID=A0A1H1KSA3_9MICO|nr:Methyltransferase domain-containing protein [Agrococcus carbonis]